MSIALRIPLGISHTVTLNLPLLYWLTHALLLSRPIHHPFTCSVFCASRKGCDEASAEKVW